MSWNLLQRFLESDVFNQNPFLSVSYLSRYADHVGIHYVLCNKLRQFPYEEIEFFLPQLCHLIISVDNESMALEEFVLDLCEESVTAALLTFWLFQTYLHDLSSNSQSESFKTCRRLYNKVQHIVFGLGDSARHEQIQENVFPVSVLASFVLASVAVPTLSHWAGPLAVAQARKPQPIGDAIPESAPQPQQKMTRAQTVTPSTTRSRRARDGTRITNAKGSEAPALSPRKSLPARPTSPGVVTSAPRSSSGDHANHRLELQSLNGGARLSTSSLPLPDTTAPLPPSHVEPPTATKTKPPHGLVRRRSDQLKGIFSPEAMTSEQKVRLLRQNYFRCQTQFLTALEGISNRLVIVPKPARLSALRAELALITQDLPAEVDIPVICPPTLINGAPSKSRHHRVVRLNPAEATVLNSAEKVPYLLMVEIVTDDFNFDPDSQDNQRLLTTLLAEQGSKKRIFDTSDAARTPLTARSPELAQTPVIDSVFEPMSGDVGKSPLLKAMADGDGQTDETTQRPEISTPITSESGNVTRNISRTGSPLPRSSSNPAMIVNPRNAPTDQTDFSALATHMRTASQMLAQLQATSGKRPRSEVAAIRARIIASMQSLEEQSFEVEENQGQSLDLMLDKARPSEDAIAAAATADDLVETSSVLDAANNAKAGQERMENDIKTGGVQRKGDRDDPSAAVFGEAWDDKKERIRRSSPFGWMKNWDLVSVIVKTGADLRQEAFACQLIDVCHRIWSDAKVPVWVKLMRILVTGESSGLIETITNGVSLHSLKRSLTLSMAEAAAPRQARRFATLKDHFAKAFGAVDSEPYRAAVDAFKRSLAAYSVISYVLQLKDRHNGNLLIDNEGHIVHIDFGFMLSNSPGSVGFEAAPFKLTYEYIEVLGGLDSQDWEDFKSLCKHSFQALRRQADMIIDLVAIMGRESKMPCYTAGVATVVLNLRQRFQLQLSAEEAEQFVETDLVAKSLGSYYTRLYDTFQYRTQGIY